MTIEQAVVEFPLGSFRATVDDGVVRGATFDPTPQPVKAILPMSMGALSAHTVWPNAFLVTRPAAPDSAEMRSTSRRVKFLGDIDFTPVFGRLS